jgi:hypothetical protein
MIIQNITRDFSPRGYEVMQFFHFCADIKKRALEHRISSPALTSRKSFLPTDVRRESEISHRVQELFVLSVPPTLLPDACTAASALAAIR